MRTDVAMINSEKGEKEKKRKEKKKMGGFGTPGSPKTSPLNEEKGSVPASLLSFSLSLVSLSLVLSYPSVPHKDQIFTGIPERR